MLTILSQLSQNKELRYLRLTPNTKKPIGENWQQPFSGSNYNFEELLKTIKQDEGVGLLCGTGKPQIIVIDVDKKGKKFDEFQALIERELPQTLRVKTPNSGVHNFFYVDTAFLPDKKSYIPLEWDSGEIRAAFCNVAIFPTKINGSSYAILEDSQIATTTLENILTKLVDYLPSALKNETDKNSVYKISKVINLGALQQQGSEYHGAHPIHGSETGSNFWVNPEKGIWHCFRHHSGGDAITWCAVKNGLIKCEQATKGTLTGILFINAAKAYENETREKILAETRVETRHDGIVTLPTLGKSMTEFSFEVAENLKGKNVMFYRVDSREIVEVGDVKVDENGEKKYVGFIVISPHRFITLCEEYMTIGMNFRVQGGQTTFFKQKSMSAATAATILESALYKALPQISRIFTTPLPIVRNGELTFPTKGFDTRFSSWLSFDSPEISDTKMSLEDAKRVLETIFKEFCFESEQNDAPSHQDRDNAIAALLTPFLKGLFTRFNIRTPIFFYLANRERAGKDYLAGITGLVYEGYTIEEPPLSTSENAKSNNTEELRKKILAAMKGGRKRLHFANNKGYIDNATLEAVATQERHVDRVLGVSKDEAFDNELDFSLSGNAGVRFTPDLASRCRFIRLFLDIEDANKREFTNPDLWGWVKANRSLVLSALFALVRNWREKGSKLGSVPFASFYQWASICGGIMEAAGYLSPCNPDKEVFEVGGDSETTEMKSLFEFSYKSYPDKWVLKSAIILLVEKEELFGYLNFHERADQTRFGNKLNKFIGRVLSGIRMSIKDKNVKGDRREFLFTKKELVRAQKSVFDYQETSLDKLSKTLESDVSPKVEFTQAEFKGD